MLSFLANQMKEKTNTALNRFFEISTDSTYFLCIMIYDWLVRSAAADERSYFSFTIVSGE